MPQTFAIALLLLTLPSSAIAATLEIDSGVERNTLVELYTSQGCSSCPPAERWLGSLQNDPRLWHDIVPLAFHVDYWDYLGWKDKLASPAHSARQRRYSRENGLSTVYTPGFVVNGREWRRWYGLRNLPLSDGVAGRLTLQFDNDRFSAVYRPQAEGHTPLVFNLALLAVGIETRVTRGENAGKTLPQDFVVLQHLQRRSSDNHWQGELKLPDAAAGVRLALSAWVSPVKSLAPLQAVGGWLGQK